MCPRPELMVSARFSAVSSGRLTGWLSAKLMPVATPSSASQNASCAAIKVLLSCASVVADRRALIASNIPAVISINVAASVAPLCGGVKCRFVRSWLTISLVP